ncbi:uncharacterized protein LOC134210449 [Armigeres subalbatus]|uniref:uncharacterized protein LOC134210449 n=1 Tax=Armigeres subalbatus TaxID=124917 RepID=UPI002ED23555
MSESNSLRKYLEREFGRINARIDKVEQQNQDIQAHQRATRDVVVDCNDRIKYIQETMEPPVRRMFPLGTREQVETAVKMFENVDHSESLKKEIAYVLGRANKEDWLRSVFADQLVSSYHTSEEIRNLNFVKHIIRNITFTVDKQFTALVNHSRGGRIPNAVQMQ